MGSPNGQWPSSPLALSLSIFLSPHHPQLTSVSHTQHLLLEPVSIVLVHPGSTMWPQNLSSPIGSYCLIGVFRFRDLQLVERYEKCPMVIIFCCCPVQSQFHSALASEVSYSSYTWEKSVNQGDDETGFIYQSLYQCIYPFLI